MRERCSEQMHRIGSKLSDLFKGTLKANYKSKSQEPRSSSHYESVSADKAFASVSCLATHMMENRNEDRPNIQNICV